MTGAAFSGLHDKSEWGRRPYMYEACGLAYIVALDRAALLLLLSVRLQHLRMFSLSVLACLALTVGRGDLRVAAGRTAAGQRYGLVT